MEDISYELPPELIAQEPAAVRHESRLLWVNRQSGAIQHRHFKDIVDILSPGDVLVVNNTQVVPARLIAKRQTGGQIKLLLLKPETNNTAIWQALVTPIKHLKTGEKLTVLDDSGDLTEIVVHGFIDGPDGYKRLLVNLGSAQNVFTLLNKIGHAPLPPYIHRDYRVETEDHLQRDNDLDRYQTVFAKEPGAVAAPTAGLHFSDTLMNKLRAKDIEICEITLHVGPGTFKPITDSIAEHVVESEVYAIPQQTANLLNRAHSEGRRIIAVGTTSLRTLETAGSKGFPLAPVDQATTSLYIKPGYHFKVVNGLITNFHLTGSSLLVLVATFAGKDLIKRAYHEAIQQRYRFFSYGDAMLII
jgi:S-adenosylmethionine:tRNA ribosyltransferase-isomerase